MIVTVRLFGPFKAALERGNLTVRLDTAAPTIAELRTQIATAEPRLARWLPASRFAVNHEFAAEGLRLRAGDEVALIGLVSGG